MKVLITGTNGFLGAHLLEYLKNKDFSLFAIARKVSNNIDKRILCFECDINDRINVEKIVGEVKPNVVIHCAAMSKPNDCELDKELAYKTNYEATVTLLNACKNIDNHFVFLSTDFVYGDGENKFEDEVCYPINYYAETKYLAENFIKNNYVTYTIVRPVFIYGKALPNIRTSFVQWVMENLEKRKELKLVNDQFRTPTFVDDICEAINKIIMQKEFGV